MCSIHKADPPGIFQNKLYFMKRIGHFAGINDITHYMEVPYAC